MLCRRVEIEPFKQLNDAWTSSHCTDAAHQVVVVFRASQECRSSLTFYQNLGAFSTHAADKMDIHALYSSPVNVLVDGTFVRTPWWGCFVQIALEFPHCFWDEQLDYFGAALPGGAADRGLCFMFWSLQRFCGAPVLLAIVSGDAAYASEGRAPEALQEAALQVLRKLHGEAVPAPTACDASQWLSDEFARGGGGDITNHQF